MIINSTNENRRLRSERQRSTLLAAIAALCLATAGAFGAPSALTAEQWRDDILELSDAIDNTHPDPWKIISRSAFMQSRDALISVLGSLSDKEIIVRMAMLVARLEDGHTRLRIPPRHPRISVRQAHSETAPPEHAALLFEQLPVSFEAFSDGVFVGASARDHADLIGARVEAIGDMPIEEAMDRVGRVVSAENAGFRRMMSADRLALPGVLRALDIVPEDGAVSIEFRLSDGRTQRRHLQTIGPKLPEWTEGHAETQPPLWTLNPDRKYWWTYLERYNIVYLQIDEIANEYEYPLAGVVKNAVNAAESRNARLVIDLRWNFGGNGSFNRAVLLGLLQSGMLNDYGRSFTLIGPRTFSAAQMLVNDLEKWSRVLFVGLPTGARPDHHGDSRKTRLAHSGLTVRISTLHWPAYNPTDRRDAVLPLLEAPFSSRDWFAGRDPALAAIAELPHRIGVVELFGMALEHVDEWRAARFLSDHFLDPRSFDNDLSASLVQLAESFGQAGNSELADLTLRYGLYFYPHDEPLASALRKLEET